MSHNSLKEEPVMFLTQRLVILGIPTTNTLRDLYKKYIDINMDGNKYG